MIFFGLAIDLFRSLFLTIYLSISYSLSCQILSLMLSLNVFNLVINFEGFWKICHVQTKSPRGHCKFQDKRLRNKCWTVKVLIQHQRLFLLLFLYLAHQFAPYFQQFYSFNLKIDKIASRPKELITKILKINHKYFPPPFVLHTINSLMLPSFLPRP